MQQIGFCSQVSGDVLARPRSQAVSFEQFPNRNVTLSCKLSGLLINQSWTLIDEVFNELVKQVTSFNILSHNLIRSTI